MYYLTSDSLAAGHIVRHSSRFICVPLIKYHIYGNVTADYVAWNWHHWCHVRSLHSAKPFGNQLFFSIFITFEAGPRTHSVAIAYFSHFNVKNSKKKKKRKNTFHSLAQNKNPQFTWIIPFHRALILHPMSALVQMVFPTKCCQMTKYCTIFGGRF